MKIIFCHRVYDLKKSNQSTIYWKLIALSISCLLLTGCESLSYYTQAVKGHWHLYGDKQSISQALKDQRLSDAERQKLALVPNILEFAKTQLKLPSDDQYQTLVFMDRHAVTWNVFAAPVDAFTPRTWCFPMIGCISYRGYFKLEDAQAYAKKLETEGWETYISGAAAYSTLGWFEDPILNTFLKRPTPDFVGLLFHELAHQQLYIKNDTTFNESFATTIEIAGIKAWYENQPQSHELTQYLNHKQYRDGFIQTAMATKNKLNELYNKKLNLEILSIEKDKIIQQFRQQYEQLVLTQWNGQKPYHHWVKGPLNNAQWNTLGAYYDLVPALTHLLEHLQYDYEKFYSLCKKLGDLPKSERHTWLAQCSKSQCPLVDAL